MSKVKGYVFAFASSLVMVFSLQAEAEPSSSTAGSLTFANPEDGKEPWNLIDEISDKRPEIQANRWTEKWSALYNPKLRTEPLDELKYISLDPDNPYTYASFGMNLRERYENLSSQLFGITPNKHDNYLLHRLSMNLDIRIDRHWQIFTQFEDVRAPWKRDIHPADVNKFDARMAFVGYQTKVGDEAVFKGRVGRQGFAFDLQRFVSLRQGPNVQQAFDAVWADWEQGPWRIIGILSHPVQYQDIRAFDDYSNSKSSFHMFRVERHLSDWASLSAYYARFENSNTQQYFTQGNEKRNIIDVHFDGKKYSIDWDLEGMGQFGHINDKDIRAWAAAARLGYTFTDWAGSPRIGIQFDSASGSHNPNGHTISTFNPLFPNGYYFTLAGFTGYSNLMHIKPSITFKPASNLTLTVEAGMQWRQTRGDFIYVQPNIPVPGTAGKGSHWSGVYEHARLDWAITPHLSAALMEVYYQVGDTIREAGGHNSNYSGAELDFAW